MIMKFPFVATLLLLVPGMLHAQLASDSLHFSNQTEAQYFQLSTPTPEDAFSWLFAIESAETRLAALPQHRQSFFELLDQLGEKASRKKPAKQGDLIYQTIHDQYLKQYVENPLFSDIFQTGQYNCATASALYAIACEYLKLPYQIREEPTHVYLILFPQKENIVFETTLPSQGATIISPRDINQYKKFLVKNKLITSEEAKEEDFLGTYLLESRSINLQELIGWLYYNSSITYAEKEEFELVYNQLQKAYTLYPLETIEAFISLYLFQLATDITHEYGPEEECQFLVHLYFHIRHHDGFEHALKEICMEKGTELLSESGGENKAETFLTCLAQHLPQDSTTAPLFDVLHFQLIYHYHFAGQAHKILPHALKMSKNDEENRANLIGGAVIDHIASIPDPKRALDSLHHYQQLFPAVAENSQLKAYQVNLLMRLVYVHFELNEVEKGMAYYKHFRDAFTPGEDIPYHQEDIGEGFSAIYSYYLRTEAYQQAKDILIEGLKYAPYSITLRKKQQQLYNYYPELAED